MISAVQAAKVLCEESNWSLTNLKLQKMLYIAHMFFMGENDGTRLIDTSNSPFQAWDYGPVSPNVYGRVRVFGASPVGNVFRAVAAPDADEGEFISEMYEILADWTPGQLVAFTHRKGGAWDQYYDRNRRGVVIPDPAILDEYRKFHTIEEAT